MSNKTNGVKYSKQKKTILRREKVIERLESQLQSGKKPVKHKLDAIHGIYLTDLDEYDVKRIKKEIETLRQRV